MKQVRCICGSIIPDYDIVYYNDCNEDGEDCYNGEAKCPCGKIYEWIEWGECLDIEHAKEDLIDYINQKEDENNTIP